MSLLMPTGNMPVLSFNLFANVNWDEEKVKYERGEYLRRGEPATQAYGEFFEGPNAYEFRNRSTCETASNTSTSSGEQ